MSEFTHNFEAPHQAPASLLDHEPVRQEFEVPVIVREGENIPQGVPETHVTIDPVSLTIDGLIEQCGYYAKIAATNRSLAEKQAERGISVVRENAAMRQQGRDDSAIRSHNFSAMSKRLKQKVNEDQKPDSDSKEPAKTVQVGITSLEQGPVFLRDEPANRLQIKPVTPQIEQPAPMVPQMHGITASRQREGIDQSSHSPEVSPEEITPHKIIFSARSEDIKQLRISHEAVTPTQSMAVETERHVHAEAANPRPLMEILPVEEIKSTAISSQAPAENIADDTDAGVEPGSDIVLFEAAPTEEVTDVIVTTEGSRAEAAIDDELLLLDKDFEIEAGEDLETLYTSPSLSHEASQQGAAQTAAEDTSEASELLYDAETVDTYHRLAVLAAGTREYEAPLPDAYVGKTETPEESQMSTPATPNTAFPKFEAFLVAQPVIEEPVTLEVIKDTAAEQPVEQSFVLLVEYLAQTQDTAELSDVLQVLRQIEMELPECYSTQDGEVTAVRITPEMTDYLLRLLRTVGHRHPADALVDMVSRTGAPFLLDALAYVCEMTGDDRHEIMMVSASVLADDREDMKIRLGKLLFNLIARRSPAYSI